MFDLVPAITAFGSLIWQLTQLVSALSAAFFAFRAYRKSQEINTKTDAQTVTIKQLDRKADDAIETAIAVDKKTDEQNVKLDDLATKAGMVVEHTNGHLAELRRQIDEQNVRLGELTKQYVGELEKRQDRLMTHLEKTAVAATTVPVVVLEKATLVESIAHDGATGGRITVADK